MGALSEMQPSPLGRGCPPTAPFPAVAGRVRGFSQKSRTPKTGVHTARYESKPFANETTEGWIRPVTRRHGESWLILR